MYRKQGIRIAIDNALSSEIYVVNNFIRFEPTWHCLNSRKPVIVILLSGFLSTTESKEWRGNQVLPPSRKSCIRFPDDSERYARDHGSRARAFRRRTARRPRSGAGIAIPARTKASLSPPRIASEKNCQPFEVGRAAPSSFLRSSEPPAPGLYSYGKHSWRFRIDSSDQIEVAGAEHVAHAQIMEVMGGDIGRNIFFVPLAQRKQQLEQIPWVESASVMRFVPNRLRIEIHERTPVAFVRIGSHISLIDAGGTLMELAPGRQSANIRFPVITGMNAGEPLSMRAARMKNYNALVRELDSSGAHYSQELSEVDLGDPEDVKVLAADAEWRSAGASRAREIICNVTGLT